MAEELKYLDRFKELDIEEIRTNKDGVLIVNIPLDRIDEFVNLSLELMQPGRWNEYVGPRTGFYFKMPSGEKLHYLLNDDGWVDIKRSLQIFLPNWKIESKEDLWNWLPTVDIYSDWLNSN